MTKMPRDIWYYCFQNDPENCVTGTTAFFDDAERYTNTDALIEMLRGMKIAESPYEPQYYINEGHNAAIDAVIKKLEGK